MCFSSPVSPFHHAISVCCVLSAPSCQPVRFSALSASFQSAVSSIGPLSASCSLVSSAVGLFTTLASTGPSPLHPFNPYIQAAINLLTNQQQSQPNGLDGAWAPSEGEQNAPRACNECKQLRKEWAEMKQHMTALQTMICSMLQQPSFPSTSGVQSPGMANITASLPSAVPQRKRPAPMPPQPECPVALRPITTACPLPSHFLNWPWSMPTMQATSPTLPSTVAETVPAPSDQVKEHKWSSPSSVESAEQKTDSSGGDTNIDIVGMDGSESSTSSNSTQAMVTSPDRQNYQPYVKENPPFYMVKHEVSESCYPFKITQTELGATPISSALPMNPSIERKHRKQISDDYVKIIRQQDLSEARISKIQIPVAEAIRCDPSFRAVSEQQIIQQIVQNKKFEDTHIKDSMVHLCKKLAEKRVFGAKLMSQTTVAGLNHSNYSNLPIEGIVYIQHVCRKVMGEKFSREEDFWDAFREATKKLAARCRRVRHAKKSKNKWEEGVSISRDVLQDMKPECSVASTLLSLNIPQFTERKSEDRGHERSAAETLQSMSRPASTIATNSLPLSSLQALTSSTLVQGLSADSPAWEALMKLAKSEPQQMYPKDAQNEMQPISP